jgi:glycosyltransferase involved in cell wall biosynthesis
MTSLSILIPTHSPDRPLKRCLRSIASQPLLPGDEVLVIGDTTDRELPEVAALVADFGPQYRYLPHPGTEHVVIDGVDYHSHGHEQLTHGLTVAAGDLIVYQDDDDCFTEGAFGSIRAAAEEYPGRPLMFRFVTRFRTLVWGAAPVLAQDHVGGHCFVVPNRKAYLAPWTPRYQGDWDHIRGTLDKWPGGDSAVVWREEVISLARPNTPEDA